MVRRRDDRRDHYPQGRREILTRITEIIEMKWIRGIGFLVSLYWIPRQTPKHRARMEAQVAAVKARYPELWQ